MKSEIIPINCRQLKLYPDSHREKIFRVVRYTFNYYSNPNDKVILNDLKEKGMELAKIVSEGAANDSSYLRPLDRRIANAVAGVISEYLWRDYINLDQENNVVEYTPFEEASNQIDLITTKTNKKIEVRSSFPRNGIQFAVCSKNDQFDIIGPYSNNYKPTEIEKDYYVRALFHLQNYNELMSNIKLDGFNVYLTGGATWDMMYDNSLSLNKDFIPQDRMIEQSSIYRVVPFSNALDSVEIKKLIIE